MPEHEKINYIELPSKDLEKTKTFFKALFKWQFTDYGPDYVAFAYEGLEGGFYKTDKQMLQERGSALVVFYSSDLESTYNKVIANKGVISTETFDFPGGRRFHFKDLTGNEYAVWSDQ